MSGFLYVWINNINNKYYIGSHKGTIDDGYIGSGTIFKKAVKKYGIENFIRYVEYEGPDFRQEEDEILQLLDVENDPRSYNLHNHSRGGVRGNQSPMLDKKHSKEAKDKMKGRIVSKETRIKVSKALTGYKHSKEVNSKKSHQAWNKGKKMLGVSESNKKRFTGKPWTKARRAAQERRINK